MKKQIVSIITCVILAVCFVAPVSAAQYYPQKTFSSTVDNVSHYGTLECRGYEVVDFEVEPSTPSSVDVLPGDIICSLVLHMSFTIRNRSDKIAVASLNNFIIKSSNFYTQLLGWVGNTSYLLGYSSIYVSNSSNVDVYDISFNSSASGSDPANTFTISFRSTEPLVLEPDQQLDMQFDLCIPFSETWNATVQWGNNFYSYFNSSTWTLGTLPSYTLYTVSEYASSYEGFWPFLLRYIESINARLYQDEDDYNAVEDDAIDVGNSAGDANYGLETVGEQEHQWYEDNTLAISQTGLSNFQYSQDQVSGISHVVGQWQQVWSALGSWSVVYQFVLMLSLATFILRHRPTTKMQQRQKQRDAINEFNWDIRYARDRYWQNRAKWSEQQLARSSPDSSGNGSLTALALKRRRGQ